MKIDLYRQILIQCFPHLSIASIKFIGGGTFRVFEVKTAALPEALLIFRFPHGYDGGDLLRREQRVCDLLGPLLPFPIPRYEYFAEGCSLFDRPVGGYHKLEGTPLQECGLGQRELWQGAAQLGFFLSALHSLPPEAVQAAGIPAFSPSMSRGTQHAFYAEIQQVAFSRLNSQERMWTRNLFEPYLAEKANWEYEPVLVHGDFDSSNILYDLVSRQVRGIIDFEGASLGDPAWDLCALLAEYGSEFLQRILAAYPAALDARFRQRVTFHSQRILFHELLYGIHKDAPALVEHGRARLQRAMTGLEPIGGWLAVSTSETRWEEGYPA